MRRLRDEGVGKKIKGLVSGGNLPYHAQYIIGIKKIFIWNNSFAMYHIW